MVLNAIVWLALKSNAMRRELEAMLISKHHLVGLVPGDVMNFTSLQGTVPMLVLRCTDCKELYIEPVPQIGIRRDFFNSHCDDCEEIQKDAGDI